jgi:uncharacterized membrane protein
MGFFELPSSVAAAPLLAPAAPVADAMIFYFFGFAWYIVKQKSKEDTKDVKGTVVTCHQGFACIPVTDQDPTD